MYLHPVSSGLCRTWQRVEYLLSANTLDSTDSLAISVPELLPPDSAAAELSGMGSGQPSWPALERNIRLLCIDGNLPLGGSWQWILVCCERHGPLHTSNPPHNPGAWQPEQPTAPGQPSAACSRLDGVGGQPEVRQSSGCVQGNCVRWGVQFLQDSEVV